MMNTTTQKPSAPTAGQSPVTEQDTLSDALSVPTPTVLSASRTKLRDMSLSEENYDLIGKVIWLINNGPGWSEDDTFTFPDGETWARFDTE